MNLPPKSNLTDKKYAEILSSMNELGIRLEDIEEKFVKGSGSGGQKVNKSVNAVQLKHLPTGTLIKYHQSRDRSMNRIMALRALLEKLNPNSKSVLAAEKKRKQKKRRVRRSNAISSDSENPRDC